MTTNEGTATTSGRSFDVLAGELSSMLSSFRKPADVVFTLIYSIPVLAPVRFCIETGIFQRLVDSPRALTAGELAADLAKSSIADDGEESHDLVARILRPLCALRLVDEVSTYQYQANDLTAAFADPGLAAGFKLVYDNCAAPSSTMGQISPFLVQNGFKAPSSANDGPFQRARNIVGTSTFDHWVQKEPEQLSNLSTFMERVQRERPHWSAWFPADALYDEGKHGNTTSFQFVDVGGGRGHDLFALAAKYPEKSAHFVLQDQPSVIDEGVEERRKEGKNLDPRFELSKHNFFEAQPIKGADVYYMHKIMHDWPDVECVVILSKLKDAMGKGSRILVNDIILPEKDCPLLPAAFDITMLALHSGQERDEAMWKRLVAKVGGLSIQKFWHPPGGEGEGIVEIVRSEDGASV